MSELIQQKFDFSEIDETIRQRVVERDIRFDITKQQVEGGLIEMGKILIEQKADLKHGHWLAWLKSKDISVSTAGSLIQIAEKFTNSRSVGNLGVKVLQLLSQDSTPESARVEAIEKAQSGSLTINETKSLIDAHKLIDDLEKKLSDARSQIPTEDIKAKIIGLEKKLEAERNKPAQVVEVVPDDYEESKSEVTRLVDEKGRLLNQIKRIKDAQTQEVTSQVNQKLKELEDDFILKNKQLDAVQGRIDVLRPTLESMEKVAGALSACKTASKDIRHNLTNISITISDLFSDYEIPESEISGLLFLADEMAQGAVAFKRCLNDKNQTQIGE